MIPFEWLYRRTTVSYTALAGGMSKVLRFIDCGGYFRTVYPTAPQLFADRDPGHLGGHPPVTVP